MEITKKYGLILDGEDDYYDIAKINANFQALESAVLGIDLSTVQAMTEETFAALTEKDAQTLYIVTGEKNFTMYLGELPLKGGASVYDASMAVTIPEAESMIGDANYKTYNLWNYWQETDNDAKTTATITALPTASCLLVAAVMHRDTVTIEGDGWKHVVTSQTATGDNYAQNITVWTKSVEKGSCDVTVTQASSVRMGLKVFAIYEAKAVSVVDDALLATVPFVPTATTGKRRLYLLSSIYATGTTKSVTVTDSAGLDLKAAEEVRFSAFYDYEPELLMTPTFSYQNESGYNANSMNAITLNIEEV